MSRIKILQQQIAVHPPKFSFGQSVTCTSQVRSGIVVSIDANWDDDLTPNWRYQVASDVDGALDFNWFTEQRLQAEVSA